MKLFGTRVAAKCSLQAAQYSGKKLALLHTGAALLFSLVVTACNLLLSQYIEKTTGLGGIGTRSVLQAIQSLLSFLTFVLLPFWQMGFVFACIRYARHEQVAPTMLWEGFRRFGKFLRLSILQTLIYSAAGIACFYVAGMLFSFTPFVGKLYAVMEPIMQQGITEEMLADPALTAQVVQAALPLYILAGVLLAVVTIFLFYRMRMATFAIMDDAPNARTAIAMSFRMMRKNGFSLFRADMRFLWFYILKVLIAVVAYGDVLLGFAGITLPVNSDILFLGFYILYALLELWLNWQWGAYIQTTYAHCYQILKETMPQPNKMIQQ